MGEKITTDIPVPDKKDMAPTENIFDEFAQERQISEEPLEAEVDMYTWFQRIIKILQVFVVVSLCVFLLLFAYISIQKNENFSQSSFLDPICFLFVSDIPQDGFCSSITSLSQKYNRESQQVIQEQSKTILSLLDAVYQVENFHKTRSVVFLSEKTRTKLPVNSILSAFDDLKLEFDTVEKNKIQCYNIKLANQSELTMTCDAYSAWFEKGIKWFDANRANVEWTSLSIANSFLNFIEKKSNNFTLLNRQKVFSTQTVVWEQTWYTLKTSFSLHLKYKTNTLSL